MIYKQLYPTNDFSNIDKTMENASKNLAELVRIDSEQPKNAILYRYFKTPYADGQIHYQVIEVNGNTCTIMACQGINLDEWDKGTHKVELGFAKEMIKQRTQLENFLKNIK